MENMENIKSKYIRKIEPKMVSFGRGVLLWARRKSGLEKTKVESYPGKVIKE